jgi:hypothetical protein
MMNTTKRYFAIGFKNHVELRVARKPPTEFKSEAVNEIRGEVYPKYFGYTSLANGTITRGDDGLFHYNPPKFQKKKTKIAVVYHQGGKVIGTLGRARFSTTTGLILPPGGMIEITVQHVVALDKFINK